jgi:ATP-dependent DNA helicase RecG
VSRAEGSSVSPPAKGRTLTQLASLDVGILEKVSDKKRTALASWGVETVLDLLWRYPRRYIDRTRQADLKDLAVGDEAVVLATVTHVAQRPLRNRRAMVEVDVDDGTGSMRVVFFNQAWRSRQLRVGSEALFFGKLDEYRGKRQMTNPVVDLLVGMEGQVQGTAKTRRIIPVYPQSSKVGLTSWEIGTWVAEALTRAGSFADPLERDQRDRLGLVDRTTAMQGIHAPETLSETEPARRRLAFDELFRLQLALLMRRRALEADARGIQHLVGTGEVEPGLTMDASLVERFIGSLEFSLTAAQERVLGEIFGDLASTVPMHRLLQGDVGSGKTVVAVAAMLAAVQGGFQGALMAPTEVLAEQHFMAIVAMIDELDRPDPDRLAGVRPVAVALLTSSVPAADRRSILEGLEHGTIDIVVGTHALLTDSVTFSALGVAVVDEQHRFGVEQRAALREKGRTVDGQREDPDLLVMTATPIPRTAAMVVFGDLEMSVLDQLPEGRRPISTRWARSELEEIEVWARVREEVAAGRQAYVVCPLVDGSDRIVATSATEERARLEAGELSGLRVGLLHGQLKSADKEQVMSAFRSGALDVLVATTVIEVGVDVANATVMVIEDAGRFGIAQLHQLRGRVGRGAQESFCDLLGEAASSDATTRLEALESSGDGFALAEVDLEVRGEGTILGSRQKGKSDLALASLSKDRDLLFAARDLAEALTDGDPRLEGHPLLADELKATLDEVDAAFLFKS